MTIKKSSNLSSCERPKVLRSWDDLSFWQSEDWEKVQKRLDEYDRLGLLYNPSRDKIFATLDAVPFDQVRAVLVGQDPYVRPHLATGFSFSVSKQSPIPPSLDNILKEYSNDLHYPYPRHGDISCWSSEGVLMWNVYPTSGSQPLSHHWDEWGCLTREVFRELDSPDIPIVFMGGEAGKFSEVLSESPYLCVSHPSPRGANRGKHPFLGSRPFSWINDKKKPFKIEWRIPDNVHF